MTKLLALLPSAQDKHQLRLLEAMGFQTVYVEDSGWKCYEPCSPAFDALSVLKNAIQIGREERVDGIFYSDDLANLMASIVARELDLPAPSIESMFLANHKYYARTRQRNPIRFSGHPIDEPFLTDMLPLPSHLKPTSLSFSLLQTTVHDRKALAAVVQTLADRLGSWQHPFKALFRKYVDAESFPLATREMILAEEFIVPSSQHAVEGWTDSDGRHHLWAVSDNNYFDGLGEALDNNAYPSRLSAEMQQVVVDRAFEAVSDMGIRNGFWNVELWILPDGSMPITEVNGRGCVSMTALYNAVTGKSQYPLMAKLCVGMPISPDEAPQPGGRMAGMFAISTQRFGRVADLIDLDAFETLSREPDVVRSALLFDKDRSIEWRQTGGRCCLARAWIVGESYEAIHARAQLFRQRLLREES